MIKKTYLLVTFLCLIFSKSYSQTDSLQIYVRSALDLMKDLSVNKHKIDWEKIYEEALAKTDTAQSIRATYPIIEQALVQLGDRHSKFFTPEVIAAYNMGYRALGMDFPIPQFKMIEGRYAYITVPAFYVNNLEEQREYAASIHSALKYLDKQKPEGWIIDLRKNDGGMSNPMLAGIGSFIEKERTTGWKNADGEIVYWTYNKGRVFEGNKSVFSMDTKPYKVKSRKKPVAVLIGKNTASAAEVLAAAFVDRPYTKLIGTNSTGLTSSNGAHELSDGAYLVLTEGNYVDRNQKEYSTIGEGIAPDIKIENPGQDKEKEDMIYIEKAVEYLSQKTK